ncbi:MAG TPA: AAA family ATPase, partial [Kofleriaceae bacterium]
MAKLRAAKAPKAIWRCQACGHVEAKWNGRCPQCQAWSSLVEELETAAPARPSAAGVADGRSPVAITDVVEISAKDRRTTGIGELDRVLGGGMVAGCLVLLGGDPGVGKSTLLVQALAGLARAGRVLYATGEESVAQTAMRARRVGAADAGLRVVAETNVERILAHAEAEPPAVLAVDSIQTVYTPMLDSIPGSLAQVRECASRLMQFAKTTGTPTIIVGHVTKDGAIA